MNLDNRQFIEIVGITAVIISLLIVAYELRQSNNIALVTTEYEIRNNYAALDEAIMTDPDLADLLFKTQDANYQLDGGERIRISHFMGRFLNVWRAVISSYERGLLDRVSYEATFDNIRLTVETYPAIYPLWRQLIDDYPSREADSIFVLIDEILDSHGQ